MVTETIKLSHDGKLLVEFLDKTCKEIVIPKDVTEIGLNAFKDCSSLVRIEIPNSVTKIGMGAFKGCTSLKKIIIPDSVTEIDFYAFYVCI